MLREEARRTLHHGSAVLFDLAADLERYPQYVPGWISVQVLSREPEVCRAEQVVGFGPMQMRFRTQARLHRPDHIEVTSDDPRFTRFRLLWRFENAGAGNCQVALGVELELRSRFLQGWMERAGAGTAADVLVAFERRARQLHGPAATGRPRSR